MKARAKGKEIMKVAAICVLSIGMFSAAFIGFNQLIFAAAINEATPLYQQSVSADYITLLNEQAAEQEADAFIPPTLTVLESPSQHYHAIPAAAMSMEEAAQIGARYIWDVFGTNIDGMYMQMMFAAHASQTNTWWTGTVYVEHPDNPTQNYIVDVHGSGERFALPVYMFTINGITGERINISYDGLRGRIVPENDGSRRLNSRTAMLESGWFDMNIYEQIEFAGLSGEMLEVYMQTAAKLAEAQFNISGVANVQLLGLIVSITDCNAIYIEALNFTAVDNNGRDAFISIPATDSAFQMAHISTSHNDFIPDFEFHDDGLGRG
ncbi:MAG: hypothetical protein FWB91_11410 [Defluviitaleaceae bacterium]|nr:hypothetical protein [Defluviitaleaceae bacterium]